MDMEQAIKGIQECDLNGGLYGNCPYKGILALLKEQDEETRFVYDEYIQPTCEKCTFHPFAGYIPTIKWMQERGYMKCPRCGRSIKW